MGGAGGVNGGVTGGGAGCTTGGFIFLTSQITAIAMTRTIAAARIRPRTLNHVKIFGFGVVDDDRGGGFPPDYGRARLLCGGVPDLFIEH